MLLASPFKLWLLGNPYVVRSDGQRVAIENPLMLTLLALLMLNPRKTFLRSELCTLFYPEHDKKQAEQNLRQMIHRLRKVIEDSDDENALLLREPMTIRLNPQRNVWVDVTEFNERIQRVKTHHHRKITICKRCISDLEVACNLYSDEFMSGIYFYGALEEWAFTQRVALTRKAIFALDTLTTHYIEQGHWLKGQTYLDRWLAIDALDEDAIFLQMRLFATEGKRLFALQFYQAFTQLLEKRLATAPNMQIRELANAIKHNIFPNELLLSPKHDTSPLLGNAQLWIDARSEISTLKIPFVGRHQEVERLIDRLTDKGTRLIVITGMGGIGKTALALQVATLDAQHWHDGVMIISPHPSQNLFVRLAEVLSLSAENNQPAVNKLYEYLRDKEMLLILDQIDQMIDFKYAVKSLLFHAPNIKIIGTSRQRLGIGMELNMRLGGLYYPNLNNASITPQHYDSIQLFLTSSHTFHPQITFSETDLHIIGQLCHFIQGSPLGIILASTWTREFTCQEIFERIQQNTSFLTDRYETLPKSHNSFQATFNQSWSQLSALERKSLRQLATANETFTLIEAQASYAVSPDLVTTLADKSLLETPQPARFEVHPLFKALILNQEESQR